MRAALSKGYDVTPALQPPDISLFVNRTIWSTVNAGPAIFHRFSKQRMHATLYDASKYEELTSIMSILMKSLFFTLFFKFDIVF